MTDAEVWDEAVDEETAVERQVTTTPPTVSYVNESGYPDELILADNRFRQEVASVIEQWTQSLSPNRPTAGIDVFARERWNNARHPFAIMSQCAWAVENDDILSTLADVSEGLALKKMRFELNDDDQQDLWNQWARDVDLDTMMRTMWRDLYKVSQFYVGLWWERRIYKVRDNPLSATIEQLTADAQPPADPNAPPEGTDPNAPDLPSFTPPPRKTLGRGNRKRKKQFAVEVPTAMTVFDPTKILPVGTLMFGRERFAYIATDGEDQGFAAALNGDIVDPTVMQLVEHKYNPTPADRAACGELGVDSTRLWMLKPGAVYRHTLTRAQYERFAPVRLKAILEILDLKKHQRASDRASLIGNTNFIVVITKGSDKLPAKTPEIENLKEQARVIARLPVLVGDHRLHVEIISPRLDHTLMESRWQVLDSRLVFKALGSFQPLVQGGNASTGVSEMGRVVSQGFESRRHMLVRSLERYIFREVMRRNEGVLDEEPSLAFAPKRVTLDFNNDIMQAILKLRDRGDVSRESTLDEFDYDQDTEVVRRAREKATYDKVFNSGTPFSSPTTNPFAAQPGGQQPDQPAAGPEGGRPPGVPETQPRQPANKGA